MGAFPGRNSRREWLLTAGASAAIAQPSAPELALFFRLLEEDTADWKQAMNELSGSWNNSYAVMVLELVRIFLAVARGEDAARIEAIRARVMRFLAERTRKSFGEDARGWSQWVWSLPYEPHPQYGEFKGLLYAWIDPRMRDFFPPMVASKIRLDQIEWGGVRVNGIPPLVHPAMIPAADAGYLGDSNVVFGIESDGKAKAYPKRILAWHEMAIDKLGALDLTIVYCTLCGTVIPYLSSVAGRAFSFGTSGLLYQSSKLMFDAETKSLWPTLQGRPMVGPLAGTDLALDYAPVVTSTWGEWRRRHPGTLVLSTETGHQRDYSEGAAYRAYFGSQELMFGVSRKDRRLKNKDEVLIVRLQGKTPLAISTKLLERQKVFEYRHEGEELVVRTDGSGANRVYRDGQRIPAYRAFWFGWYAQFPETILLK